MFNELVNYKGTGGLYSKPNKLEYKEVLSYALDAALDNMSYYGGGQNSIIKDDTFEFLWESCPEERSRLLDVVISKSEDSDYNYRGELTTDYCLCWAKQFYNYLSSREELSEGGFQSKMRLAPIVDREYNYLAALSDAELRQNASAAESIRKAGIEHSVDSNFFDYCFSKVKRAQGAVDKKAHIIGMAIENEALSDGLIKAIAKSSPVSLKRQVASYLSSDIKLNKKRSKHQIPKSEKEVFKNKVVHAESMIMLFASTADYNVIMSLAECISKDNFPWIMPAVSSINHYWLTRKVERAMEAE